MQFTWFVCYRFKFICYAVLGYATLQLVSKLSFTLLFLFVVVKLVRLHVASDATLLRQTLCSLRVRVFQVYSEHLRAVCLDKPKYTFTIFSLLLSTLHVSIVQHMSVHCLFLAVCIDRVSTRDVSRWFRFGHTLLYSSLCVISLGPWCLDCPDSCLCNLPAWFGMV